MGVPFILGCGERRLDEVVSWDVVAEQYNEAYQVAHDSKANSHRAEFPKEF